MSEDFKVEVSVTCDRTGRVHKVPMTVAEAGEWAKNASVRKDMAEQVASFLKGLPPEAPDLAILYKGKAVVLQTVISKENDSGIGRLLHELTHAPEFPEVTATPRKNKTAAVKESATPQSAKTKS